MRILEKLLTTNIGKDTVACGLVGLWACGLVGLWACGLKG